jgi:hypothetical protein
MVEFTLSLLLQIVQTVGILVGIVYYVTVMRHTETARQTQMFMPIYSRVIDAEYRRYFSDIMVWEWSDYDDWERKYYENRDEWAKLLHVLTVQGLVGLLLERKQIDLGLVSDVMRVPTIRMWDRIEPIIEEFRVRWDFPEFGEPAEYLYREMKKRKTRELKPLAT